MTFQILQSELTAKGIYIYVCMSNYECYSTPTRHSKRKATFHSIPESKAIKTNLLTLVCVGLGLELLLTRGLRRDRLSETLLRNLWKHLLSGRREILKYEPGNHGLIQCMYNNIKHY